MNDIITVTLNTAVDCIISEKDYEVYGNNPKHLNMIAAGKGLNVSKALASKGQFSICLGYVGADDRALFNSVSSDLIRTDFIYLPGATRRNITISQCRDGLEHHETNPGFVINEEEKNWQIKLISSYFKPGRFIIFSGSLPRGLDITTYRDLISLASGRGLIPILDTSGPALMEGIKAGPYIIKPNREELQSLTGENLSDPTSLKAFIRDLAWDNKIEYILTTLSEKGALLYIRKKDSFIEARPYSDSSYNNNRSIISSVGCGDCSLAGFVYGISKGLSDQEALQLSMKWAFENLYARVPGQL